MTRTAPLPTRPTLSRPISLATARRSSDPALAACAEWTATYPVRRVKKRRNRTEAICPMVAPSIADQSMRFSVATGLDREPSPTDLDEVLEKAADQFLQIRASDPVLRCLVLVLPEVRGQNLLDATHPERGIKDELMRRGILVGEFFPSCPFATTFNPRLFALRSPAPMYVLRTFIETDWRFICQIPRWQETYRLQFGEPPKKLRHLGGPVWRFLQKFRWRIDALKNFLFN